MPIETEKSVQQTIIDQINRWSLLAFNNDHTPFQMVFLILKTVVPLSEEEAFEKTNIIHENGKAIVYTGTFEHCQKIAAALSKIKVDSEII